MWPHLSASCKRLLYHVLQWKLIFIINEYFFFFPNSEDYYGDLDIKTLKKAQLAGFAAPEKKPVPRKEAAATAAEEVVWNRI